MPLTKVDGFIEEWEYFYDTFVSTVDRNEKLTSAQKFQYLRATVTGKAARSIQSLEDTDANYSIAFNLLKEKFDYHRRICMRHWDLLQNYPKTAKEISEAVEDLPETFKVNLKTLDKLDLKHSDHRFTFIEITVIHHSQMAVYIA
jgi:hypothetical protein